MIETVVVAVYFLIGLLLGRQVFTRTLGTAERYQNIVTRFWTPEFTSAVWWGILTVPGWPVTSLVGWMFSSTPHEKQQKSAAEQKQLEKRFRELEHEVLQFGKNL